MSTNWQVDVDPAPRILVLPRDADSLDEAHAAIELWEFYKRRTLDSTQRLVVEVLMATRPDGLWAAQTTGREMARQNGKGDEIEVVELWGLTQRHERILHTVHEAVLLTTQAQERLLSVLEGHPDLRRLTGRPHKGVGQQMIPMRNGGVIWYRTRTGGGARGVDEVDRVVIDEAQHAEPEHLAALTPTMFMASNPQMNALGSAGIEGKSAWWWQIRKAALDGDDDRFGYVGHTAERVGLDAGGVKQYPVDVEDRALWRLANPALAAGRGNGEDWFAGELRNLGPALFAREHLCVWDGEPGMTESAIPNWAELVDPASKIATHRCIALDVSPDRKWSCFGAAGRREDGKLHVVVTGTYEQLDHRAGTAWVVERGVELSKRWKLPVRIEKGSPAAAFVTLLREAGAEVLEVTPGEHAAAAGMFLNACANDGLRHIGQQALSSAVKGAELQKSGESDKWGRRTSKVDITPLVAVTIALGGVPSDRPPWSGPLVAVT